MLNDGKLKLNLFNYTEGLHRTIHLFKKLLASETEGAVWCRWLNLSTAYPNCVPLFIKDRNWAHCF
jgi:hypothetical protein